MEQFIYCPRCSGKDITETDYEEENDQGELEVDEDGRACETCGWEGDVSELVSKE